MRPIVFNKCFGWLHKAGGDTGVILCNPYGHEALWTHRGWRTLATVLARNGFPALRFDYRGTGDSIGAENEGDAIETWLGSIVDAVHCMREQAGVTRIVLCGVRLGGTLAALVTNRVAVDGLVMMAPITSGREYLRELRLIQRRWRNTSATHIPVETEKPEYVETLGFRLYPETLREMEKIALPQNLQPVVPNVLLLDPEKARESNKVLAFYREHGVNVEVSPFDDYVSLLSEGTNTPAPLQAIDRVVDWMSTCFPSGASQLSQDTSATALKIDDEGVTDEEPIAPTICGDGFCETPVVFDNGRLFGIYCRPEATTADSIAPEDGGVDELWDGLQIDNEALATGQYAVLFANTAASHHIGEARMWVSHARRLAKRGIASLRMDVGVLGDSKGALQSIDSSTLHDMRSCADLSEGINWLVDAGHTRPTPVGICSGAYLCFHATVMNPRAVGVVLVNQNYYLWSEKNQNKPALVVAPTRVYLESARNVEKWKRLLSGQIPIGMIISTLLRRYVDKLGRKVVDVVKAAYGGENRTSMVRKAFSTLAQRGVNVRILYGEFDAGLEEAQVVLGRDFKWLRKLPGIHVSTERNIDHAMFLYPARELMLGIIETHLHDQASGSLAMQASGNLGSARQERGVFSRRQSALPSVPVEH